MSLLADIAVDRGGVAPIEAGRSRREPHYNADFDWDRFNSAWYHEHNYLKLRDDDTAIMERVGEFFEGRVRLPATEMVGLDVGSGANLYPTMAMLPFCRRIDLREYSRSNVKWLSRQVDHYDPEWDAFWDVYRELAVYEKVIDPRQSIREKAQVERRSIFHLRPRRWDIGTMFFVAESVTRDRHEFNQAVRQFGRSLRVGSPFAAAFMAESTGYTVDGTFFPAVAVGVSDVKRCLAQVARDLTVELVPTNQPLRGGYGGMILATGVARSLS